MGGWTPISKRQEGYSLAWISELVNHTLSGILGVGADGGNSGGDGGSGVGMGEMKNKIKEKNIRGFLINLNEKSYV